MSKPFQFFHRSLLVGCMLFGFAACKDKSQPAEPTSDDESAVTQGERRGHKNPCDQPDPAAHIAKLQKCQTEAMAACNTQVYGTATPTKDAICGADAGSKDKMKAVWKCSREKYGDDKDRHRADRKKMKECMSAQGDEPAKPPTTTPPPADEPKAPEPPVT